MAAADLTVLARLEALKVKEAAQRVPLLSRALACGMGTASQGMSGWRACAWEPPCCGRVHATRPASHLIHTCCVAPAKAVPSKAQAGMKPGTNSLLGL